MTEHFPTIFSPWSFLMRATCSFFSGSTALNASIRECVLREAYGADEASAGDVAAADTAADRMAVLFTTDAAFRDSIVKKKAKTNKQTESTLSPIQSFPNGEKKKKIKKTINKYSIEIEIKIINKKTK